MILIFCVINGTWNGQQKLRALLTSEPYIFATVILTWFLLTFYTFYDTILLFFLYLSESAYHRHDKHLQDHQVNEDGFRRETQR